jgi:iron complex outermembrane recepter protein
MNRMNLTSDPFLRSFRISDFIIQCKRNVKFSASLIAIAFFLFTGTRATAQNELSGRVTDKVTGEILPGATVFFPDLKIGTSADQDGLYRIKNLPNSSLVIQVTYIGYKAVIFNIDLTKVHHYDAELIPSAIEAREVVVTGNALSSENDRSSISITPIGKNQLLISPSTNLINAISTVPGVAEISTGGEISKPVIRGLSYNRIVTINNGMRQEGSQWGDEHGVEIDQFSADHIEVLKGPASLFYGSDAMGGVINILEQTPANPGSVNGEWVSQASTNNRLLSNSLMFEGNHDGWIWSARGTYKTAASYRTPKEWVYNSGFREANFSAMAGVVKRWGYTHLHFSTFNTKIGMVDGLRDSTTNQFIGYQGNIITESEARSRSVDVPFQDVNHDQLSSVTNLVFKDNQFKISVGYQWDNRKEFGDSPSEPGLYLNLSTLTYDVRYTRNIGKSIELAGGFAGMTQGNRNHGSEYLIPDFDLQDWGGFIYGKKTWEKFTFNLGVRFDTRSEHGYPLYLDSLGVPTSQGDTLFQQFDAYYSAFSGSTGLTFRLNKALNFKFNIGRGFRAPNISELSANGLHEGTFRYEIGNPNLNPEASFQVDGEISWEIKWLNMVFNGYYNFIDNFIYYSNSNNEQKEVEGIFYPVYRYIQGNSVLKGFEFELDIHPVDQLHFDNNIDYVMGTNISTGIPLPYIPALHLTDQLKWTFKTRKGSHFISPFIQAELETHFAQTRIDVFEVESPAYVLLNFSAGTRLKVQNQVWTLVVNGTNLLDKNYYDHLSRLKDVNVNNMGRRITLSLVIPFGLSHGEKG